MGRRLGATAQFTSAGPQKLSASNAVLEQVSHLPTTSQCLDELRSRLILAYRLSPIDQLSFGSLNARPGDSALRIRFLRGQRFGIALLALHLPSPQTYIRRQRTTDNRPNKLKPLPKSLPGTNCANSDLEKLLRLCSRAADSGPSESVFHPTTTNPRPPLTSHFSSLQGVDLNRTAPALVSRYKKANTHSTILTEPTLATEPIFWCTFFKFDTDLGRSCPIANSKQNDTDNAQIFARRQRRRAGSNALFQRRHGGTPWIEGSRRNAVVSAAKSS